MSAIDKSAIAESAIKALLPTQYLGATPFEKDKAFQAMVGNKRFKEVCGEWERAKKPGEQEAIFKDAIEPLIVNLMITIREKKAFNAKMFLLTVIEYWAESGLFKLQEGNLEIIFNNIGPLSKKGAEIKDTWKTLVKSYMRYLHGESTALSESEYPLDKWDLETMLKIGPIEVEKAKTRIEAVERTATKLAQQAVEKKKKADESGASRADIRSAKMVKKSADDQETFLAYVKTQAKEKKAAWLKREPALRGALEALSAKSIVYGDLYEHPYSYPYRGDYEVDYSQSHPLIGDNSGEYWQGFMVGGVFGGATIVFILVVFCIGLAFGMVTCWAYMQQRALEKGRNKEDYWKANEDENDGNL